MGGTLGSTWGTTTDTVEPVVTAKVQFAYGPDRARYRKLESSESGKVTTWYVGKQYERIESGIDGSITHKFFVYAAGDLVAIHSESKPVSGDTVEETHYIHRDALGSVDTVTDAIGGVFHRSSHDPFGQQRAGFAESGGSHNRGFTGHEHVFAVGIIHMNGRVYDPLIGRFLSPDPHVQAPYHTQNLNRYSYVLNNPLKYTDPSGFFFKKLFREIAKVSAKVPGLDVVVQGAVCISAPGACGYFVTAWNTAVTYGATGSLSVGLRAGLISGASFWLGGPVGQMDNIGLKMLGNGLIGGAASRAMGGHFGRGFLSAGFAAGVKGSGFDTMGLNDNTFMHGAGRTLIAASIGGTTSSIVGGKFANGAYAAAFAHLANYERTRWERHSIPHVTTKRVKVETSVTFEGQGSISSEGVSLSASLTVNSEEITTGAVPSCCVKAGSETETDIIGIKRQIGSNGIEGTFVMRDRITYEGGANCPAMNCAATNLETKTKSFGWFKVFKGMSDELKTIR